MSQGTPVHSSHSSERHSQLRLPRVGEPAPALVLPTTDGTTVDLATAPKPVALVFLRHLM